MPSASVEEVTSDRVAKVAQANSATKTGSTETTKTSTKATKAAATASKTAAATNSSTTNFETFHAKTEAGARTSTSRPDNATRVLSAATCTTDCWPGATSTQIDPV